MFNKKQNSALIIILLTFILIFDFSIAIAGEKTGKNDVVEKTDMKPVFQSFKDSHILVGLTELYLGSNNLSGNLEAITGADKFKEKVDMGRISFYLKGKIRGKYLLTAWLDTEEQNLDEIFSHLDERRLDSPFEKINPEKYYPVYGDNSKVSSDVNTAGKLYLCLESEELKALWGSYKINYNQNQLIDFNRSLYGFNLNYESDLAVNTFWQQPFSRHSQDELQLTGGMLYYLRDDDLINGSENLKLELRDAATGRVKETISLVPGIDYELNYLQGRIILKKSIDRLTEIADKELIEDENGEDKYYLVVDYEYDYDYKDSDNEGYGLETSYQLTDSLILGGTYFKQQDENGEAYRVSGVNLNYIPFTDASLQLDLAQSENILSGKYISDDGGLSYEKIPLAGSDGSSAWNLEYEQKIKDNRIIKKGDLSLYYSDKNRGFSSGSQYVDEDTTDYGIKLLAEGKKEKVKSSLSYEKNITGDKDTDIYTMNLARQQNQKLGLELELRSKQVTEIEHEHSLTGAAGFDYQLAENKKIYGSQQLTIDKSGDMEQNNITKLGGEVTRDKWSFNAEGTTGDKDSLKFGAGYQINKASEVYTSIERNFSGDGETDTETTVGASSKLNEKTEIYGEHRIDDKADEAEKSNVVGIDYSPMEDWLLNLDYSLSEVDREDESNIKRKIIGLGSSYDGQDLDFTGRMEYRKDDDSEDLEQFILTSDFNWRYNQKFTLLSEMEYSREKETEKDEYMEGTIGLAYRPVKMDRLNLLGKYTYLAEDSSPGDGDNSEEDDEGSNGFSDYPAERAQVFSVDAIYDINTSWELAEKLAYKNGKVKLNSVNDEWTRSETSLWINRLNYQLREDIELFGEYRILENKLARDRKSGFLVGGYKRFDNNLKLGAGYNFTDFNDDLTDLSYEAEGWFVNIIKAW